MKTITKEFKVFTFNELNKEGKDKARLALSNSDYYMEYVSENAQMYAEQLVIDYVVPMYGDIEAYDEDPGRFVQKLNIRLDWDTCSASFVRNLDLYIGSLEIEEFAKENKQEFDTTLLDRIKIVIQDTLLSSNEDVVLDEYLEDVECEYMENGDIYID